MERRSVNRAPSVVSRDADDYRVPNLLDDNDEALATELDRDRYKKGPPSPLLGKVTKAILQPSDNLQQRSSVHESSPYKHNAVSQPKNEPSIYRQHKDPGSYALTPGSSRVVIAIDYGTTYTGFALAGSFSEHADLQKIEVLQSWGSSGGNQSKVRSMISYMKSSTGETQWGSNISDQATAMVNTKLELEPQATRFDELELTWLLLKGTGNLAFDHLKKIGPNPIYPSASPGKIVTDYLAHICKSACESGSFETVDLTKLAETNTPLDIVITVPANWSLQAIDATFKAVRGAGFNRVRFPTLADTILVSEPEAAAFFAIRDHQTSSGVNLVIDDCFILCDAGGGTVDVVSYQVKKVTPHLQLEKVTEPSSGKYGSAFIDIAFKRWLRHVLGDDCYAKLDPLNARTRISTHSVESGPMRKLLEQFIVKKQLFSNSTQNIKIDLPEPLNMMDKEGRVRQGELTIYSEEMKDLFDDCVDGVINLLDDQIEKLRKAKQRRARDVFLVGGFGASPYLKEQLKESLDDLRGSKLRRPDSEKSLTAVVQGAVVYGVEKSRHKSIKYMSAITESFGIVLNDRFEWLIRKGDLVLSSEKRTIYSKRFSLTSTILSMGKYDMPIYRYKKRCEDDDDVPDLWEDGQHGE
ncbi:hypothetical protein LTR05_007611 [Lithohypha guttulata]|uniref:Actin-like ATPase domain-containing protein n=1 Tax=Lithohypha guttulata TaxID=1690604 RepID=A0AAN7YEB8_9EURO|nr:hypothetical protein LTR05_007611 [Lithohypha guttulata]